MSTYRQLLRQALVAYGTARQKVRGPSSTKRISDAVEGFAEPSEALSTAVTNAKAGSSVDDAAVRDALRSLSAQRDVLQSAIERAESDDDLTVKGVVIQQSAARALADKQRITDQQLLAKIDEVLGMVREDAAQRGDASKPTDQDVVAEDVRPSGRADPPQGRDQPMPPIAPPDTPPVAQPVTEPIVRPAPEERPSGRAYPPQDDNQVEASVVPLHDRPSGRAFPSPERST